MRIFKLQQGYPLEWEPVLRPVHIVNTEMIGFGDAGALLRRLGWLDELQIVEWIVYFQVVVRLDEPHAQRVLCFGVAVDVSSSRGHGGTVGEHESPGLDV